MIWVTWRQHRLEGVWSLVFVAAMTAALSFVTWEAGHPGCPAGGPTGFCLPNDSLGFLAQNIMRLNLVQYGPVVLPALAGAFIGAPLVAREIENGTHRLVWTQGVTRTRWMVSKLALIFIPVMGAAALVGILEVVLINHMGAQGNHWDWFDQQAPLTVAATVFALALGVAAGALIGRSIPAMAVTLVGVIATRFVLAVFVRAHYMTPFLYSSHDPAALGNSQALNPAAWWLGDPSYQDAAGHAISQAEALQISTTGNVPSSDALAAYWRDHGISMVQHYQPGDRFWTFQTIESGILLVLTIVLLGFALFWVARRIV